jgi:hypothetical protein
MIQTNTKYFILLFFIFSSFVSIAQTDGQVLTRTNGGASWEISGLRGSFIVPANTTFALTQAHHNHTIIMNVATSSVDLPDPDPNIADPILDGTTYTLINNHATNTKILNRSYGLINGGSTNILPNSTSITIQKVVNVWQQIY